MFRYFLVHDKDMPNGEDFFGTCHWIHLKSHGKAGKGWNALVMHDHHIEPHPNWKPFPKVVDAKTPLSSKIDHKLFADLGLDGTETTLEATEKLGAIFPPFIHP